MFASHKQFERNLKLYFFNDKELLTMSNLSERLVHPISDCLCNSKVAIPHTKTYSMHKNNNFVTKGKSAQVTPAQQNLLQLINPVEANDFYKSLKHVHALATYSVDNSMIVPWKHGYVHRLLDALQVIAQENLINNNKS